MKFSKVTMTGRLPETAGPVSSLAAWVRLISLFSNSFSFSRPWGQWKAQEDG